MIISDRTDKTNRDFEKILCKSHEIISCSASNNASQFLTRSPTDFEFDLHEILCEAAKGTDFENTIHLFSGHKFPDIVANKYYGVEVKTTKTDYWKSVGNSVLESTRIEDVNRIYIFFAKLTDPIGFKYKLYEKCLYDIAVTHSPRYLINMDLDEGESIFDKIGMSYDELRNCDNPIKPFVRYYRSQAKPGEEPWWMDSEVTPETALKPVVKLWSNLSADEKELLLIEALARFPEILGAANRNKYRNLITWLVVRHGVISSSLRDGFSAGGRVDIDVRGTLYKGLPRVFYLFKNKVSDIIKAVRNITPDEAQRHWGLRYMPDDPDSILTEWVKKVIFFSSKHVKDSEKFIVHLLADLLPSGEWPKVLSEHVDIHDIYVTD